MIVNNNPVGQSGCGLLSVAKKLATESLCTGFPFIPVIPPGAYNALKDIYFRTTLSNLYSESIDSASKLNHVINTTVSRTKTILKQHLSFLQEVGRVATLKGPIVYYPLGGFDSHTAQAVVSEATDVFALGLDEFGSIDGVNYQLAFGSYVIKSGIRFDSYDKVPWHYKYEEEGLGFGKGALAVARIVSYLKCPVEGIYFFNIQNNGNLKFLSREETFPSDGQKNAVIEYIDSSNNNRRRFWYIMHDINSDEPGVQKFIDSLSFQTLFIKAALDLCDDENINLEMVNRKIILPAKANFSFNNTQVVTDRSRDFVQEYQFWECAPNKIIVPKGIQYGYSQEGQPIYYGSSARLSNLKIARDSNISAIARALFDLRKLS